MFTSDGPATAVEAGLLDRSTLAEAIAAFERETRRPPLWCTAQTIRPVREGARLRYEVEVLAEDADLSHSRFVATHDGDTVAIAHGANGSARNDDASGQLHWMPQVDTPDNSPALAADLHGNPSPTARPDMSCELRSTQRPTATWVRIPDQPVTATALAYITGLAPNLALHSTGIPAQPTSIDNTIRYGARPDPDTDWLLLDTIPAVLTGGYLHVSARIWAQHGALLAVGSQSAVLELDGPLVPRHPTQGNG